MMSLDTTGKWIDDDDESVTDEVSSISPLATQSQQSDHKDEACGNLKPSNATRNNNRSRSSASQCRKRIRVMYEKDELPSDEGGSMTTDDDDDDDHNNTSLTSASISLGFGRENPDYWTPSDVLILASDDDDEYQSDVCEHCRDMMLLAFQQGLMQSSYTNPQQTLSQSLNLGAPGIIAVIRNIFGGCYTNHIELAGRLLEHLQPQPADSATYEDIIQRTTKAFKSRITMSGDQCCEIFGKLSKLKGEIVQCRNHKFETSSMALLVSRNRKRSEPTNLFAKLQVESTTHIEESKPVFKNVEAKDLRLRCASAYGQIKHVMDFLTCKEGFGKGYSEREQYSMQIIRPGSNAGSVKVQTQERHAMKKGNDRPTYRLHMSLPTTKLDLSMNWEETFKNYREHEMQKKPFDFRKFEVKEIAMDDPRKGLVGQKGLFVKAGHQISQGTILGPYTSLISFEDEYFEKTNPVDEIESERYMYNFESGKFDNSLVGDSRLAGNVLRYINDFRYDPSKPEVPHHWDSKPNCAFIEVLENDWPFVFIVATADIPGGNEVLTDYGVPYWQALSFVDRRQELLKQIRQKLETACGALLGQQS